MPSPCRPAVSVVVTNYNRLDYLKAALASVRRQTLSDRELIVVDGGSTDGSREWLCRARDLTALFPERPAPGGPAALLNAGLARARGRLVAFLESDDFWKPRYLEAMAAAFSDRRIQFACCGYCHVDERGAVEDYVDAAGHSIRRENGFDPVFLKSVGSWVPALLSMTVVRRSVFSRLGAFDPGFVWLGADLDFYYRVALAFGTGSFRFVDETLAARRRHGGQLTSLLRGIPHGRWVSRRRWKSRERESLLDLACFYRRHEGAIRSALR